MPLRTANNPNTDLVVMTAIKNVMAPNTQLAATSASGLGLELIFIQDKYAMMLGMNVNYPIAVNMMSKGQSYHRSSQRTYTGLVDVAIDYYSRWDEQDSTIDAIWASIALDLERIKANIESNDSLMYGQTNYAISVPSLYLTEYEGEYDKTFPGLTLIHRMLTLKVNVLPYDV